MKSLKLLKLLEYKRDNNEHSTTVKFVNLLILRIIACFGGKYMTVLFRSKFKRSAWVLLSLLLSQPVVTHASTDNALREYHASYLLYWQGVKVGTSEHELRRLGANLYSAESISKPFLAFLPFSNSERSQFIFEDGKIKPQRYDFKTEEKGRKIVGLVEFDWDANEIHKSIYEGAERNQPLPENALDRITYTLQLHQDLKNGKGPFTYTVIEPRKIKEYTFKIVGNEKINTPMGEFKTIKLEHVSDNGDRITQLWLAPDFDYLLVRLTQAKKGKQESEALLNKVQVLNSKIPTNSNTKRSPQMKDPYRGKDNSRPKTAGGMKESREMRDSGGMRDSEDLRDSGGMRDSRGTRDYRGTRDSSGARDSYQTREPHRNRESGDMRDSGRMRESSPTRDQINGRFRSRENNRGDQ